MLTYRPSLSRSNPVQTRRTQSTHAVEPRRASGLVGVLVAAAACTAFAILPASATALDIQSVDRLVSAFGDSFCPGCGPDGEDTSFSNGESIPNSSTGLFDESASSLGSNAWQNSSVGSNAISGTGGAFTGGSFSNSGRSHLLVTFTVPTAQEIRISGELTSECCSFIGDHFVRFSSPTSQTTLADFGGVFDQLFNLVPGTLYTLEADVSAFDAPGGADWAVSLVTIPEPGTALLFGLGLGMLGRRRD